MKFKRLSCGAGLAALALAAAITAPAGAAVDGHTAAVKACTMANEHQPATLVTAIDDGRGGSLVWVTDAASGLWLCSTDAGGQVYAYTQITGDMLEGAGASLVDIDLDVGEDEVLPPKHSPITVAEQVCQAYLPGEPVTVLGSGEDGLGDIWVPGYYVFVETGKGGVFLCDATADAQVWAFAEIGDPLTFGTGVG